MLEYVVDVLSDSFELHICLEINVLLLTVFIFCKIRSEHKHWRHEQDQLHNARDREMSEIIRVLEEQYQHQIKAQEKRFIKLIASLACV